MRLFALGLVVLWALPAIIAIKVDAKRKTDIVFLTCLIGWLPPAWFVLFTAALDEASSE